MDEVVEHESNEWIGSNDENANENEAVMVFGGNDVNAANAENVENLESAENIVDLLDLVQIETVGFDYRFDGLPMWSTGTVHCCSRTAPLDRDLRDRERERESAGNVMD